MRTAILVIQDAGFILYAGPLIILACLTAVAARRAPGDAARVIRWQRRLGHVLGLSLGACIFGALALRWFDTGTLQWHWDPPAQRRSTVVLLVFILAWISNIKLEIWTLEPLRQLDPDPGGTLPDPDAYQRSARVLSRHLLVHAALLIAVAGLEISRRAA